MNIQTPEEKAKELLSIFNEDVRCCLSLCDRMIECNIVNCAGYYQKVKEVLKSEPNKL